MEFSVNHPILFLLVGIIIAIVLGQSFYFLIKAWRRAKEKGMDMSKIQSGCGNDCTTCTHSGETACTKKEQEEKKN